MASLASIRKNRLGTSDSKRQLQRAALIFFGALIAVGMSAVIGLDSRGSLIILVAIAVVAGLFMVMRPPFGMFVLIIFVYLDLSNIIEVNWGIPSLNKLLVALIFVGVVGTRAIVQRKPLILRPTEGAVILYGFVLTASIFASGQISDAFDQLLDFAKDFAIMLIVVQLCDSEKTWKTMQWSVIVAAAFLSSLTCYQMISGDTTNDFWGLAKAPVHQIVEGFDNTRPTGPLDDPNFYAQILLMVFPMAAYRVVDEKNRFNKAAALICGALIVGAIIFTYSRSAFIMILLVSVAIILERRMNIYKFAAIGVAVLLAATPILPKGYLDRMATIGGAAGSTDTQTEASFRGRSSEAIVATQMFFDYPLLGIGYASYEENYLVYSVPLGIDDRLQNRQAHSLYLEAAAETGVIGLFAFTLMYLLVFRSLWLARKQLIKMGRRDLVPWLTGLALGLLGYLLTSIFLHDDYVRYLRLMIGLALSASAVSEALFVQYTKAQTHQALVTSPFKRRALSSDAK
jgi:O-antigen ligase